MMKSNGQFFIKGNLVDILNKRIFAAKVELDNGMIAKIEEIDSDDPVQGFILPGFVDSHVHVESSMLIPSQFARLAVVHGTVATVSDPHEIANVCGMKGVEYMIGEGATVPFKFNFGAPSCVPATRFETAGAVIRPADIGELMKRKEVLYLSEMMNFPGVLNGDSEVMQKIALAHKAGKPVDGHAPGLSTDLPDLFQGLFSGFCPDHLSPPGSD